MTTHDKIESIIEQVSKLPGYAQTEVVESLLEIRAQQLGVYHLDDDEREALQRSAEDVRQGRFAADEQVEETFSRYRDT